MIDGDKVRKLTHNLKVAGSNPAPATKTTNPANGGVLSF